MFATITNFLNKTKNFLNKNKNGRVLATNVISPSVDDIMWIGDNTYTPRLPNFDREDNYDKLITSFVAYTRVRFGSRAKVVPTVTTLTGDFQVLDSVGVNTPQPFLDISVIDNTYVPPAGNIVVSPNVCNINLHVYCFDKHMVVNVNNNGSTTELCNLLYGWANSIVSSVYDDSVDNNHYTFVFKAGLSCLVPDRKISDYNLHDNSRINVMVCGLQGGSYFSDKHTLLLPTYSHVLQCEMDVMHDFRMQSFLTDEDNRLFEQILSQFKNMLPYMPNVQKDIVLWLISQFEKLITVHHWYKKCDTYSDYVMLTTTAFHTFTGKSVTKNFLENSIVFNLQSCDNIGEVLRTFRNGFTCIDDASKNPFVKRMVDIYSYLLVHGFLQKFGLTLNDDEYSKLEKKIYIANYSSKKDLLLCVCESALFICEKLYEFKVTGSVNIWGNTASNYDEWFERADKIISLGPYTSNLEPHGMSYFEFISELKDLIEKGSSHIRFIEKNTGNEYVVMAKKLMSLKMIESSELTRRSAMKERKAPFGVLVYGTSSVAKSTFTKMLYYYYAALHKLKSEDHYRYVRNPADEYWSNFDTSKWCIQLDDIAFLHPNKASEADPTLMELLNVVNNVPYVPPQAALEDKGRTPVLAQLVIATTNAIDLNAHEYFWCPLAIRRRLPYVVEVRPKAEFTHENGKFIDPVKLYEIDGEFPDYWIIQVSKIVPFFDGQRDLAKLELVKEFNNINEFLKDFGHHSLQHLSNQDKTNLCDTEMKKLHVCPACLLVTKFCTCDVRLQSEEQYHLLLRISTFIHGCITGSWWRFWMSLAAMEFFLKMHMWWGRYKLVRYLTTRYASRIYTRRNFHRLQESFANNVCRNKSWLLFVSTFGLFVLIMRLVYNTIKKDQGGDGDKVSVKPIDKSTQDVDDSNLKNDKEDIECEDKGNFIKSAQNSVCQAGEVSEDRFEQLKKTLLREERNNVWYNSTTELATFEVPTSSLCIKNISDTDLRNLFDKNICSVIIRYHYNGKPRICYTGAIIVTCNYVIINNHTLKDDVDEYEIEFVLSTMVTGVTPNFRMSLYRDDIVRNPSKDLAMFRAHSMPPRRSILKYWGTTHDRISRGLVLSRQKDGTLSMNIERNIGAFPGFYLKPVDKIMDVYMVNSNIVTSDGDCGNLLVNMTPRGPIISGIHAFGSGCLAGYVHISCEVIDDLKQRLDKNNYINIEIQGGDGPVLEVGGKPIALTTLHHKSVFRYLEKGTAELYGSLNLPRVAPKSKVAHTPLSDVMSERFNFDVTYGKPVMSGWEPWRKNLEEMVQPPIKIQNSILSECVKTFTQDILDTLPLGWRDELFFLNKLESVNGIDGVMFVDRINVSSSMGFPWNTSKKKFATSTLNSDKPDEITFSEEIWDRFDDIVEKYTNGVRAYPVFSGHLKDEATSQKKIDMKKTRLFTGAPIDWSLVVRSRLLSFVRLVQKNKFIFEAGPGTVCQSTEWGLIYKYLVAHGKDKIVAGDYGKYDKRMIADIILAAFQIIINVHKAAGFTEVELKQIAAIGYDVAFSIVNVNGDLVGFYGTEPSGHPLTVIINSLVNSLYMRYAYTILNPLKTSASFKRDVNLFTYGDDNIMGISDNAPWFNHTSIQAVMASIGVEYTMADKETESKPYSHIDECNFLKRKWVWDENVGAYLCPLELESIFKSLCIGVPSNTICREEQMVSIISSANLEFFFHGKEWFEKHHRFFQEIISVRPFNAYVSQSTLPDWQTLKDKYWKASEKIVSRD